MNVEGQKVLILGTGKTGKSVASFLKKKGAVVILADEKEGADAGDFPVIYGPFTLLTPTDYDLIIQSPGISRQHPFLMECDRMEVPVYGEVELSYHFIEAPVVAITGTNGKTTTTCALGHLLTTCHRLNAVVGNVGTPVIEVADVSVDAVVLEASSYQLETVVDFRPHIGIVTNLTPDHLERHKTMENYLRIKGKIGENMGEDDYLILNREDDYVASLNNVGKGRVLYFSSEREVEGIYLEGDDIYLNVNGKEKVFSLGDMKVIGRHNVENMMASFLAAYLLGCDKECLLEGVKSFAGVPHRLEFIRDLEGVSYYNDSKSTNPEATVTALNAFPDKNVYVILGGSPKEVSYEILREPFKKENYIPILQGATKDEIGEVLEGKKYEVDTLKEALLLARSLAKSGEVILLSPSCASFDQFKNFEVRGDAFKEYVNELS